MTVIITTLGSFWEIDEENARYRRAPRGVGKREDPAWGDERAGALQDEVWHPYTSWTTKNLYPSHPEVCPHLVIHGPGGRLQAPKAEIYTPEEKAA